VDELAKPGSCCSICPWVVQSHNSAWSNWYKALSAYLRSSSNYLTSDRNCLPCLPQCLWLCLPLRWLLKRRCSEMRSGMTRCPWTSVHHKKPVPFPKVNLPDAALSWASGSFRLVGESLPSSRDLTATQLPMPTSPVFRFFFTCEASITAPINLLWDSSSFSTLMVGLAGLAGGLDGLDSSRDSLFKDSSPKDQSLGILEPSFC
jgi:hypothetical protein